MFKNVFQNNFTLNYGWSNLTILIGKYFDVSRTVRARRHWILGDNQNIGHLSRVWQEFVTHVFVTSLSGMCLSCVWNQFIMFLSCVFSHKFVTYLSGVCHSRVCQTFAMNLSWFCHNFVISLSWMTELVSICISDHKHAEPLKFRLVYKSIDLFLIFNQHLLLTESHVATLTFFYPCVTVITPPPPVFNLDAPVNRRVVPAKSFTLSHIMTITNCIGTWTFLCETSHTCNWHHRLVTQICLVLHKHRLGCPWC